LIPRTQVGDCAFTVYNNLMSKPQYYYVMCEKGSSIHRAYVLMDPASADVLHDSLCERYDLAQVCDVPEGEVESDILIDPAP